MHKYDMPIAAEVIAKYPIDRALTTFCTPAGNQCRATIAETEAYGTRCLLDAGHKGACINMFGCLFSQSGARHGR